MHRYTSATHLAPPMQQAISDPHFEVVFMTPEWATKILTNSQNINRKITKSRVLQLTRAIERGDWKVTNQGIALDANGGVIDGQHRLAAIAKAKRPVRILLAKNCNPDIFTVIDIGKTRTAGDMLTLSGCKANHMTLAAAIKMYINYTESSKVRWGSHTAPHHAKIVKYWQEKEAQLEIYYPFIQKCHRQFRCFSKAAALTLCLVGDDYEWRTEEMMEFFSLLSTGANLPAECSILSFRNQLSNPVYRRKGNGGFSGQLQLNAMLKSFNDWKTGKVVKKFMSPTTPPMIAIVPRDEIVGTDILEIIKQ